MFKNESDFVVTKAQKRYEQLAKQRGQEPTRKPRPTIWKIPPDSASDSSGSSTPATQRVFRSGTPAPSSIPTRSMTPPIEDQALGFFFANYKIEPSIVPRGQFEFLAELLKRNDTERILHSSVNAASLASLANTTKSPLIMKRAREEYGAALAMTNRALKSRNTAVKDSTLISVLMLGMYENFVYEGKDSLQAWAKHVNGACVLIALRGTELFKSNIGIRVFQQFYGTVLLVAAQTNSAIPEAMAQLWEKATLAGDYSMQGRQWTTRLVRFMYHAIQLNQDKSSDPVTMVTRAIQLDHELDSIKALTPEVWQYETVYLGQPAEYVYGNSYHIYLDPWIAQMWNNLRSTHLRLHKVLYDQLRKGLEQDPPLFPLQETQRQFQASEQATRKSAADICASTPQLTGQVAFPDLPRRPPPKPSPTSSSPSTSASAPASLPPPPLRLFDPRQPKFKLHPPGTFTNPSRPTGMHHLIFPLYAVGQYEPVPPGLTQWAIDRLHFLAFAIGTRQPLVLAEGLKQILNSKSVSDVSDGDELSSLKA